MDDSAGKHLRSEGGSPVMDTMLTAALQGRRMSALEKARLTWGHARVAK